MTKKEKSGALKEGNLWRSGVVKKQKLRVLKHSRPSLLGFREKTKKSQLLKLFLATALMIACNHPSSARDELNGLKQEKVKGSGNKANRHDMAKVLERNGIVQLCNQGKWSQKAERIKWES